MTDTDLRKQAYGRILDGLNQFSTDEMLAHAVIVERTNTARPKYGAYRAAQDDRDFRQEGAQELADFVAYLAMQLVGREARRQERIRCFIADEAMASVMPGIEEMARVGGEEAE